MQIYSINSFNYYNQSFEGRGKPIDLRYIAQKRSYLVPPRVMKEVNKILKSNPAELPSLKEVHQKIYSPLLECKTLDKAKNLYPEFKDIQDSVIFKRNSIYKKLFEKRTEDINFPLKMLQELWANLKTKDEAAYELGMPSKSSLEWLLKNIGFVYYSPDYKTLLKASDKEGNREIAQKTRAYNAANPDLMRARNKHAAQFCKTAEYRTKQRERMLEYDKQHPERRQRISEFDKKTWELCSEIKDAMSKFIAREPEFVRKIFSKVIRGIPINSAEARIRKGVFKRFWDAHPECKEILSNAKAQVRKEMGKE